MKERLTLESLTGRLAASGAKPMHVHRLLAQWLGAARGPINAARRPPQASLDCWRAIEQELAGAACPVCESASADGSVRLVLRLSDGQAVESVLLPNEGVCVSTQVGCAVGCAFCMTGRGGLVRQLSDVEILAQVALARARRPVRRVVFMGMGEPSHNFVRVMSAIQVLGTHAGFAHKNLVFSTVGDPAVFERLLAYPVKPALAVSLHSVDAQRRRSLLRHAPEATPEVLMAAAEAYARAVGYPIQYQWTLIRGINDSPAEIARLADLLEGRYAMINFIPVNRVEGTDFERPGTEQIRAIAAYLRGRGIVVKFRQSAGQDVQGGCGQLRARVLVEAQG